MANSGVAEPITLRITTTSDETELRGARRLARNGVYYTPSSIAMKMASLVSPTSGSTVVDPACGDGSLLSACATSYKNREVRLVGIDIDKRALERAREQLEGPTTVKDVLIAADFCKWDPRVLGRRDGDTYVIMNPPFRGYGRISKKDRNTLRKLSPDLFGRFNLADAFFLLAVGKLRPRRIVALMPASFFGRFHRAHYPGTVEKWEILPDTAFDTTGATGLFYWSNLTTGQRSLAAETVSPPLERRRKCFIRQGVATGADGVFIRAASRNPDVGFVVRCARGRDAALATESKSLTEIWIPRRDQSQARNRAAVALTKDEIATLNERYCVRVLGKDTLDYHEEMPAWFLGRAKIIIPEVCVRLGLLVDMRGDILPLHSTFALSPGNRRDLKLLLRILRRNGTWNMLSETCPPMANGALRITASALRSCVNSAFDTTSSPPREGLGNSSFGTGVRVSLGPSRKGVCMLQTGGAPAP